ncbi:MAG: 2OG-Fe(II) oxygenase, partial [Thermoanaerobaculia bacterium]|nr:2OG-Fe(II) oxygenase [Thermoanaerobaculia bacterium]
MGRIARTWARLEDALAAGEDARGIAGLAEPSLLAFLFQVQARRVVRMGPRAAEGGVGPAELLSAARRAAAIGAIPVSTVVELLGFFRGLADSIREAELWPRDRPLWWEPSDGGETPLETIYRDLDTTARPPSSGDLAAPFAAGASRRWLAARRLLPEAFCAALHRELEAALAAGELELEPGSVGAGRRSAARADAVAYLGGHEEELLARLPRLAVTVQWCLGRLLPALAAALPGPRTHPPLTAMLARYPAPSAGYRAHLDNPGGADDNGRELAVVLYLNPPLRRPLGGELAVWEAGRSPSEPPTERLTPGCGDAALLDCRAVAHQVLPIGEGAARWSLALWLNRRPQRELDPPAPPELSPAEAHLPLERAEAPPGRIVWHEPGDGTAGRLTVHRPGRGRPRAGIVSTVKGAGRDLARWCEHHLELGFDHLLLVFDAAGEAEEAAVARRLARRLPARRLTVWSGEEVARERWAAAAEAAA